MYADRRRAFEARIGELFNDHKAAYPVRNMSNNAWRDLGGRILSALEDSFQMGRHESPSELELKDAYERGLREGVWGPDKPEDSTPKPPPDPNVKHVGVFYDFTPPSVPRGTSEDDYEAALPPGFVIPSEKD